VGAGVGLATATVVATLVTTGALSGLPLLALTTLLVLAIPSSREMSRRIVAAACVFFGGAPLLWWWPEPIGIGRGAVLVAVLAGVLAGWVVGGRQVRTRLRHLVPRVRATDALVVLAGVWVAGMNAALLGARDPERVLALLMRGWDNSAHFGITTMIRRAGSVLNHAAVGPSGEWSYTNYPQGFHASAATLMELLAGPGTGSPSAELVVYAHALALCAVIAVVMVVAAVVSLPALRRRPVLALPFVALVLAAFTLGPGGRLLDDGFPNFLVASALLATLPLVVVQLERPGLPLQLAVLGAAAIGIAHNWALLLTLAVPAAVVACMPLRGRRWPARARDRLVAASVAAAVVLGVAAALMMLRGHLSLAQTLVIPGGMTAMPLGALVTTVAFAGALTVLAGAGRPRPALMGAGARSRSAGLALVLLAGIVVAAGMGYLQIRETGTLQYYFWKYAIALQLVATVILVPAVLALIPRVGAERGRRRMLQVAGAVGLGVAVFQLYGLAVATGPGGVYAAAAPGAQARVDQAATLAASHGTAASVIAAVPAALARDDVPVILLPFPSDGAFHAMEPAQWLNALTWHGSERASALLPLAGAWPEQTVETAVATARAVLAADPDVVVIVGPEFADAVRTAVGDEGWSERVASW
jgi:hypothetical protein